MTDDETQCLSCPSDAKRQAEYYWHPGHVGVYPSCEECLRDRLASTPEELDDYKRGKYKRDGPDSFVAGYATPADESGPKMIVESDLNQYLEG